MNTATNKPASILVTDDESNIRLVLRTALESEGYQVSEASDGREALDAIRRQPPDLMVLDLNMPVLDGMAVLEQLKSVAATVARPRVIVLTAYGSIAAAVKATRLGALDFVEKPVLPSELRQTVRSVLDEPELDAPAAATAGRGEDAPAYAGVLDRVRRSLRLADYASAETLLARAAELAGEGSAEYFNLLGVLYESQRRWRLARKFYAKALTARPHYAPAEKNLRRLAELQQFGHSTTPATLGDEADVWMAMAPEPRH